MPDRTTARRRVEDGADVPANATLDDLRQAAASCHACELWERGTQTVFGSGSARSRIMFVGEQPGNEEDLQGEPFVGPAGRVLDRALAPNAREVRACRAWLDAEIDAVRPAVVVLLGETAAQALLGPGFRVSQRRGEFVAGPGGTTCMATVHPSSVLRAPDDGSRRIAMQLFTEDLRQLAAHLASSST